MNTSQPETVFRHHDYVVQVRGAQQPHLDISHVTAGAQLNIQLGVRVDGKYLGPGATLIAVTQKDVAHEYYAYHGKSAGARKVDHREVELTFVNPGGQRWQVGLRIAPDGIAFQYRLLNGENAILGLESTTFTPVGAARSWVLEYQTWYETPRFGSDVSDLPPGDYGFPLLLTATEDRYVLASESGIDGKSSGARPVAQDKQFLIQTADEEIEVAPDHCTPWRVFICGTLPEIVASNLVDDLAPAADPEQLVVPRPGRGAWSWWSSQYSGAYLDVQKRFTDFAAEQGWEHVLVDCGWDTAWVPKLVSYASERGIQVHLWSAWDDLDGEEALKKLALWKSWGVAGIKVDFMESESQVRYQWYDAIIAESARQGLIVNFHGSIFPRGWARTYPHVITYEGIRGAEYYVFYGDPLTAAHNVIQPFTRNVVGAMDYTPVTFSAPGRETSDAHELALGVVYESGITHFADDPDQYRSRPAAAKFLAEMPPIWDEVRLLSGHPDRDAVIARRREERWFVGGISATDDRELTIDFSSLVNGGGHALLITDGATGLEEEHVTVDDEPVSIALQKNGGFVAIVASASVALESTKPRDITNAPDISPSLVVAQNQRAVVKTSPEAKLRLPPGWHANALDTDGQWEILPSKDAKPGSLGVVTAENVNESGLSVFNHAKILVPYTKDTGLSQMPFVDARNAFGPVERDMSNGGGDPNDGQTMTVAGKKFSQGIGVSQCSEVHFALDGKPAKFSGQVAIDDETPEGQVIAVIEIDEVEQQRFELCPKTVVPFSHPVTDKRTITLRTIPVDGKEVHVDWIDVSLEFEHL